MRTCKLKTCDRKVTHSSAEFCSADCQQAHAAQAFAVLEASWRASDPGGPRRLANVGTCLRHGSRGCVRCLGEAR